MRGSDDALRAAPAQRANRTDRGGRPRTVLPRVERFDRRGIEPFELFTSEFGQNFVKIQYILLDNSKNSGCFNIFENVCEIPKNFHQTLCKIK